MVLLFDLMDTIVVDPFHRIIAELKREGISLDSWRKMRDRGAFEAFEKGQIAEEEYFERFYLRSLPPEVRGTLKDPRAIKRELYRHVDFIEGIPELLRMIRTDVPVALGSNYGTWYSEVLRVRPELNDLFPLRFFSCELGARKPEVEYYEQIERRLGTRDIAFVDDRSENLAAAVARGWKTHQFRSRSDLQDWLGDLGFLRE